MRYSEEAREEYSKTGIQFGEIKFRNEKRTKSTRDYHKQITTVFSMFSSKGTSSVGEKVIRYNLNMVGEIFKIHGSVDDRYSTLVLTEDD